MKENLIRDSIILKFSHTYGVSNLLFPRHVRQDVSILYAFLRYVDNLVDCYPQKVELFYKIRDLIMNNVDIALNNLESKIIQGFLCLVDKVNIEKSWIEAFFRSMEYDLYKTEYSYNELMEYMYGSAEIVGMSIARILNLPDSKLYGARLLGRGMQMINFVRDIYEDLAMNRVYIPKEHLEQFEANINKLDSKLIRLIRFEINLAWGWIESSKAYLNDVPKIHRIAISTATELYQWIGLKIFKNPQVIKNNKIRPGYLRAISYAIKNKIFH